MSTGEEGTAEVERVEARVLQLGRRVIVARGRSLIDEGDRLVPDRAALGRVGAVAEGESVFVGDNIRLAEPIGIVGVPQGDVGARAVAHGLQGRDGVGLVHGLHEGDRAEHADVGLLSLHRHDEDGIARGHGHGGGDGNVELGGQAAGADASIRFGGRTTAERNGGRRDGGNGDGLLEYVKPDSQVAVACGTVAITPPTAFDATTHSRLIRLFYPDETRCSRGLHLSLNPPVIFRSRSHRFQYSGSGRVQLDDSEITGVVGGYTGKYGQLDESWVEFKANTVGGDISVIHAFADERVT